jgi:hypothetical protein
MVAMPGGVHRCWQGVKPAEETNQFPGFFVREHFVIPGAHARVPDAVPHNPEHLPVRLSRLRLGELRDARVETSRPPMAGTTGIAVTARTIVAVEFHASKQLLIVRPNRIRERWRVASHGGIDGHPGQAYFPSRGVLSRIQGEQAQFRCYERPDDGH